MTAARYSTLNAGPRELYKQVQIPGMPEIKRPLPPALEPSSSDRAFPHFHTVAAILLGTVHGRVGTMQQGVVMVTGVA